MYFLSGSVHWDMTCAASFGSPCWFMQHHSVSCFHARLPGDLLHFSALISISFKLYFTSRLSLLAVGSSRRALMQVIQVVYDVDCRPDIPGSWLLTATRA